MNRRQPNSHPSRIAASDGVPQPDSANLAAAEKMQQRFQRRLRFWLPDQVSLREPIEEALVEWVFRPSRPTRCVGVVASRLGRPVLRRGIAFAMLRRLVRDATESTDTLMFVDSTTMAPWMHRWGQRRPQLDCVRIEFATSIGNGQPAPRSDQPATRSSDQLAMRLPDHLREETLRIGDGLTVTLRDAIAVLLPDHLTAVYVRGGGAIDGLIRARLQQEHQDISADTTTPALYETGSVRIVVPPDSSYLLDASDTHCRQCKRDQQNAQQLIQCGAVGWHLLPENDPPKFASTFSIDDPTMETGQPDEQIRHHLRCVIDLKEHPQFTETPTDDVQAFRFNGKLLAGSSPRWLVHCTRGLTDPPAAYQDDAWRDSVLDSQDTNAVLQGPAASPRPIDTLIKILLQQRLSASRLLNRQSPVVCFSGVPLADLLSRRQFRSHLGRWDYEPFGIALRTNVIQDAGGFPVEYIDDIAGQSSNTDSDTADLPDVSVSSPDAPAWLQQPVGKKQEWRDEQEWRVASDIDLRQIEPDDIIVFVANMSAARHLITRLHLAGQPPKFLIVRWR